MVIANSSLRASLAICHRRQGLQRKRHFEKAFTFIQTLFRLFQSAENVKCRRISLELISWGPHSSLERERKTHRRLFTSSIKLEIRHFHVVVMQWWQQNVQKSVITCKVVVLFNKPIAFLAFSLPSPWSLPNRPGLHVIATIADKNGSAIAAIDGFHMIAAYRWMKTEGTWV